MARKAKVLLWIAAAVVVVVAGVAIGTRLYVAGENERAPSALTGSPQTTAQASEPAETIDGSWTSVDGSQAGYRVKEVLNGNDVNVVGRTDQVESTVTVEGKKATTADITVDLVSVATDQDKRDQYFAGHAIDTNTYPDATFSLTEPLDLATIAESTGELDIEAKGTLSINGVDNEVSTTFNVRREAETITVTGSIPLTFDDYNVTAPDLGFVKVEPEGQIEFAINYAKS
ncbi:YceI family protein [Saxibacter everestensis]|uniref:YceI family protein n=1 Tax=Saxibacter everestensis TaxID=2909229 RepID=A0ABY8QXP4_9MICO|nr:YceI family protein [Brevibacteriaceae bacterium ZFBP1038]